MVITLWVKWLPLARSFIKEQTGTNQLEDAIDQEVLRMIQEVIAEVKRVDPVKGEWHIKRNSEEVIQSSASSLALGALLEIGVTTEDAAWL